MKSYNFEIFSQVHLANYTSLQIGGRADYFAAPKTVDDILACLRFSRDHGLTITILGGGTNVLISDKGIRGLVICLNQLSQIETAEKTDEGRIEIVALAGTPKAELLRIFLKHKLAPALFLAGIPGEIGGGVVMNAGVGELIAPREFYEIVDWIEVIKFEPKMTNFEIKKYLRDEMKWTYRHSEGWEPGVILRVGISCKYEPQLDILDKVRQANKNRLDRQPLDMPNCGSVFKNPEGHKAAQLIDRCGLKGFRIGNAQVSLKHANFIVNLGGATAEDVWRIVNHIKDEVFKQTRVVLIPEVKLMGQWDC